VLAQAVAVLLMEVGRLPDEGLSAARVHRTFAERSLISRAQGVVMARDGVNERLAYRKMAIRSAEEASPLRDVARRVLIEASGAVDHDESA
jgi:AmiR/NasT family two-component response regulator